MNSKHKYWSIDDAATATSPILWKCTLVLRSRIFVLLRMTTKNTFKVQKMHELSCVPITFSIDMSNFHLLYIFYKLGSRDRRDITHETFH